MNYPITPPKEIYLQWFAYDDEVTWCTEKLNNTDVCYVRASTIDDLMQQLVDADFIEEYEKLEKAIDKF